MSPLEKAIILTAGVLGFIIFLFTMLTYFYVKNLQRQIGGG